MNKPNIRVYKKFKRLFYELARKAVNLNFKKRE